jgi:restriction endonuclease S subunit
MRAYLGNVLVTPRASWIGEKPPVVYAVKSEFLQIIPKDGFVYFWWAYLQSQSFLHSLPIGTGGTRPRLNQSSLAQTPIEVPLREVRERIHKQIESFAERFWAEYVRTERLIESTLG